MALTVYRAANPDKQRNKLSPPTFLSLHYPKPIILLYTNTLNQTETTQDRNDLSFFTNTRNSLQIRGKV